MSQGSLRGGFPFLRSPASALGLVPAVSLPIMRNAVSVNSTRYTGRLIPTERNCESYSRSEVRVHATLLRARGSSADQLPVFPRIHSVFSCSLCNIYSLNGKLSRTRLASSSLTSVTLFKTLFQYCYKWPWRTHDYFRDRTGDRERKNKAHKKLLSSFERHRTPF